MKKRIIQIIILIIALTTGILFAHPIHEAAKEGDIRQVKALLKEDPNLIELRDETYKRTPLHWAAVGGHRDVAEFLVSSGADINSKDIYQSSPLLCAQKNNHGDVIAYLQGRGTKPRDDQHNHVQGTEQPIPGIYFTGNPPTPPETVYRAAYISAAVLLLVAALLQWILRKLFLTDKKAGEEKNETEIKKKTALKTFLITLAVVVFYFAALESVLQIYVSHHPYQKFIPDPVSHWKVNPALTKYETTQNSKNNNMPFDNGVQDLEYSTTKEKGSYRILCYGDSQTYGLSWVKTMAETYPKQLQQKLREEFPHKRIEVMNMGVAGYTSYQGLIFLKNIGSHYDPDCVILAFGYHDGNTTYSRDKDVSSENPLLIKIRRIFYRSQIYLLIRKKILEHKAYKIEDNGEPIFRRVPLDDFQDNIREFAELGKKNGFRTVLMILPQQYEQNVRHPQYADATRKAAKENNLLLIDCAQSVKGMPLDKQNIWFMEDRCHMTVEGHKKISEIMSEKLKPVIEKESGE